MILFQLETQERLIGTPHANGQSRSSGLLQIIQHGPADAELSGEMIGSCSSASGCVDVRRTSQLAGASTHGPEPKGQCWLKKRRRIKGLLAVEAGAVRKVSEGLRWEMASLSFSIVAKRQMTTLACRDAAGWRGHFDADQHR